MKTAMKKFYALVELSNGQLTQVGSPAVRFRLARCTAWVKRWSEAMDFFQTILNEEF